MKKLTLFAMLLASTSLLAQWPYFQQEHTSTTAGIDYTYPVDAHFDGGSKVYSYHASNAGGTIVVKYNTGSGTVAGITYLSRSGLSMAPVRVRTQGNYYYALFNIVVSGLNRYCLVKLDATTNALVFVRQVNNLAGTVDLAGADFILDGGSYAYVLGGAYDTPNDQNDLFVTKIDVSTAAPVVVWHNIYQNLARSEYGANIILHNGELFASFSSVDNVSFLDRGPGLLKLDVNGNYLGSRIYKYSSSCTGARASGTWVMSNGNQLTLSSTSYVGADGNGPMWLANIDPLSLVFTLQVHHSTGAAYMNPEIQHVATASGNRILMSGSAPWVNTATPGYVHYFFNPATLTFVQGVKYPSTNPSDWSGAIYDAYLYTGTGKNIFTVAANSGAMNNYYLLKTSDLGDNACDVPVSIGQSSCIMDHYLVPFTTVPDPIILSGIKLFSVSSLTDAQTESCLVVCPICPIDDPAELPADAHAGVVRALATGTATAYPNPVKGILTIDARGETPEAVEVYTLTGVRVAVPVNVSAAGVEIDFSAVQQGFYIIRATINGEQQAWRIFRL